MAAQPLNGKVAIVTGSSSGIGEAIALNFAAKGAKVTLCGRDQAKLKAVVDQVVKASGGHADRFISVVGDINDQKFRKEIIDKTVAKFGRLDILVANAGISGPNQSVRDVTEASYSQVMDTNLKAVIFLIQHAIPHLEKSKGVIINTSSNASVVVAPAATVYSVSKAAVDHLTNCLAVDLGAKGVRVNSVLPGYIPTKFLRYSGEGVEKVQEGMAKMNMAQQPLKDRDVSVNDIAEAVAFLASDAAGCITGEHIKVDGGRTYGGYFDPANFKF